MSGHVKLTSATSHNDMYPRIVRLGNNSQPRMFLDIRTAYLRMAAVRHEEHIIETTEDRQLTHTLADMMLEDTEHLLVERILGDTIVMIQSCLCCPADIKCRSDMCTCPVEDILNLVPIAHILKFEMLHRCTRNNHSVELFIPHTFEIAIKRLHMFDRRILRSMTFQFHEADLNL